MTRYAVVRTPGCYGSGETVYALTVCDDLDRSLQIARRETRSYQRAMARYGGSSGGFRVVATEARTRREASWLGHDLDLEPEVSR